MVSQMDTDIFLDRTNFLLSVKIGVICGLYLAINFSQHNVNRTNNRYQVGDENAFG